MKKLRDMTLKERLFFYQKKNEALIDYLRSCCRTDSVPKEEIVILINGCTDIKSLDAAIDIFQSK